MLRAGRTKNNTLTYGVYDSVHGSLCIVLHKTAVWHVSFVTQRQIARLDRYVEDVYPGNVLLRDQVLVEGYGPEIFDGSVGKKFNVHLSGTPFQIAVWKELMSIPSGKTWSYAEVARNIGKPRAVRAVGTACGANKLAYIVPCHRVLASNGGLGGYRWGLERKKALLAWEARRV